MHNFNAHKTVLLVFIINNGDVLMFNTMLIT